MAIRIRKDEKEALVDLLGQEWDSAGDAATAVFSAVVSLLGQRDTYGVQVAGAGLVPFAVGPFYDTRETKALIAGLPAGWAREAVLFSPARMTAVTVEPSIDKRFCGACGHPKFAHGPHGCEVGEKRTKAGKVTTKGCGCKG